MSAKERDDLRSGPGSSLRFSLHDRLRHVLVLGKTGMGKSTFIRALARGDLEDRHGFLLVDPHGDLSGQVAEDVPRYRKNDVVLFNAAEPNTCPGINPLRATSPDFRSLVVSNILAVMRKLWRDFWGPRTEHVLRQTLLALMEVRGATLDDARAMLIDDKHRRWVLSQVKSESVLAFWAKEFPAYGKSFGAEVTAPILNRLGALLATASVQNILTKRRPALDPTRAMDQGRVVLASLPKGRIGEDAALLLGGFLIGAFQHAALARVARLEAERTPFFLLIDEVGSFATQPFLELVAEARKWGIGLVLAAQSVAAMDPQVRASLLGNVGTIVAYRVGGDDAELLERELAYEYRAPHLMRLAVGEMVVRRGASRPVTIASTAHIYAARPGRSARRAPSSESR